MRRTKCYRQPSFPTLAYSVSIGWNHRYETQDTP